MGEICSVDGCGRPVEKKGWCNSHYGRWQNGGDIRADVPIRRWVRFTPPHPAAEGYSWCRICVQELPVDDFAGDKNEKNGLAIWCRECMRDRQVLANYGLSVETYRQMLAEQDYVCAICKGPEVGKDRRGRLRRLCVDHDHTCCPGDKSCGRCVRGLLCMKCNTAIGAFKEDPYILRAALAYLDRVTLAESLDESGVT